ncbi:MAG: S1/P1 nuclease [Elusimicrobia bacterium]|nr:S1/P1 nuclease [Elusimicrobiota bacterium]
MDALQSLASPNSLRSRLAPPATAVLLACGALAAGAGPVCAWGPLGHRVAALVAEARLAPESRRALDELFGGSGALAQAATCADDILRSTVPVLCAPGWLVEPDRTRESLDWHFINLPASAPADASSLDRYCPPRGCAPLAIRRQLAVLREPRESAERRRLAVMYLTHLVADLHQPLHCADDGDLGGNRTRVKALGASKSLHELWDDLLLRESKDVQRGMDPRPWVDWASPSRSRKALTRGDVIAAAALESHALARSLVYPAHRARGGEAVPEPHLRKARAVALGRLADAGIRLAFLLDGALAQRRPASGP